MAEDLIKIGSFSKDPIVLIAQERGLLAAENIALELNFVTDSPTLFRNLIGGRYDTVLNNADNVIAWCEGQGADPRPNDLIIFLGGSRGLRHTLVVHPGIHGFADLKGKVLAVDAPTAGYAIVMIYILQKHGLELNRDYALKEFGNTTKRAEAIARGEAAAGMMNFPDDEVHALGFKILARSEDYVRDYARGLGATRRDWANANGDILVRFIRAMIGATDWITAPKNKEDAVRLLLPVSKNFRPRAEELYEETISPRFGVTPRSRIDVEGIRTVLELRGTVGLMRPPLPQPEKYIDETFYNKALATLVR